MSHVHASLFITSWCNLRCKMCDFWRRNNRQARDYLRPDEWANVLDMLEVTHVKLLGVEPLLYPGFDKFLSAIDNGERVISLTTNGYVIEKYIDDILKHVHDVTVSLDGLEITHDEIRGVPGSFSRAYHGLKRLKQLNVRVRSSFAVTPGNVNDLIPLYDRLRSDRVKMVINHFNFIHPKSCESLVGQRARPSNLDTYDPANVDLDKLYKAIQHCTTARSIPGLRTKSELVRYYREPPTGYLKNKPCRPIDNMASGSQYCIHASGEFALPARCWFDCGDRLGNARDMLSIPADSKWLRGINQGIKRYGLPPACQRLCCAGKTV